MTAEEQRDKCKRLLCDIEAETKAIEEKPKQSLDDYSRMNLLRDMRIIIRRCMEKTF